MIAKKRKTASPHPHDPLLRTDRIPHIWCSGCGIGTVFGCVLTAIQSPVFLWTMWQWFRDRLYRQRWRAT